MTPTNSSPREVHSEKKVFTDNPIFYVTEKYMSSDKQKEFYPHVIYFKPSVKVLVLDDDMVVYLNREFRIAVDAYSIECPGWVISEGETKEQAAKREVREELGVELRTLEHICTSRAWKAFLCNETDLFVWYGTLKLQPKLDEAEHISLLKIPLEEAYHMMKKGEIDDANTMILLYEAYQRYKLTI